MEASTCITTWLTSLLSLILFSPTPGERNGTGSSNFISWNITNLCTRFTEQLWHKHAPALCLVGFSQMSSTCVCQSFATLLTVWVVCSSFAAQLCVSTVNQNEFCFLFQEQKKPHSNITLTSVITVITNTQCIVVHCISTYVAYSRLNITTWQKKSPWVSCWAAASSDMSLITGQRGLNTVEVLRQQISQLCRKLFFKKDFSRGCWRVF